MNTYHPPTLHIIHGQYALNNKPCSISPALLWTTLQSDLLPSLPVLVQPSPSNTLAHSLSLSRTVMFLVVIHKPLLLSGSESALQRGRTIEREREERDFPAPNTKQSTFVGTSRWGSTGRWKMKAKINSKRKTVHTHTSTYARAQDQKYNGLFSSYTAHYARYVKGITMPRYGPIRSALNRRDDRQRSRDLVVPKPPSLLKPNNQLRFHSTSYQWKGNHPGTHTHVPGEVPERFD